MSALLLMEPRDAGAIEVEGLDELFAEVAHGEVIGESAPERLTSPPICSTCNWGITVACTPIG